MIDLALDGSKVINYEGKNRGQSRCLGSLLPIAKKVGGVAVIVLGLVAVAAITTALGATPIVVGAVVGGVAVSIIAFGIFIKLICGRKKQNHPVALPKVQPPYVLPPNIQLPIIHPAPILPPIEQKIIEPPQSKGNPVVGGKNIDALAVILENAQNQLQKKEPLTDTQLDTILESVDAAKSALLSNYQYEQLQKRLEEALGKVKASEALQNLDLFPVGFRGDGQVISQQMIDHKVNLAKTYYENQALLNRLENEFSQAILTRVFAQLNLAAIKKGMHKISAETEQSIINCSKGIRAEEDFSALLTQVNESAKRDLYLDDQFIEKHYKITEKLQDLPIETRQKRREELQNIINNAYIFRELKNKGKVTTGDQEEVLLLGYLGYVVNDESAYFDKDNLYGMIRELIQKQLQQENLTAPLQFVREKVHQCALRTRLKVAGLLEDIQIDKFTATHQVFFDVKETLTKRQESYQFTFPENFPLQENSLQIKKLRKLFEKTKILMIDHYILKNMFNDPKLLRGFKNDKISFDRFQEYVDGPIFGAGYKKEEFLNIACGIILESKEFQDQVNFMVKWGAYLKGELIQGFEDSDEILGEGVCWGVSQRLRLFAQSHPNLKIEQFVNEMHLSARDRFLQGVLMQSKDSKLTSHFLNENGYAEDQKVFSVNGDIKEGFQGHIEKRFCDEMDHLSNALQISNGWGYLEFTMQEDGHATLIRMQLATGDHADRVWFFDPNFGLFCFEEGVSYQRAKKTCIEFLTDLFKLYYPKIHHIQVGQLIPKGQ